MNNTWQRRVSVRSMETGGLCVSYSAYSWDRLVLLQRSHWFSKEAPHSLAHNCTCTYISPPHTPTQCGVGAEKIETKLFLKTATDN